jgi:hypothetical protein
MGHYSDIAGQLNDMDAACQQIEEQLNGVRAHTDLDVMQKIGINHTEIVHGNGFLKVEGPQLAKIIFGTTTNIQVGGKGEFITPMSYGMFLIAEYKRVIGVSNVHVIGHKYEHITGAKIDRINGLKLFQKAAITRDAGATGKVTDDAKGIEKIGKWAERSTLQKYEVDTVKENVTAIETQAGTLTQKIKALEEEITKWKQSCTHFKSKATTLDFKGDSHTINSNNSITCKSSTLTVKGASSGICVDGGKITAGGDSIRFTGGNIEFVVNGVTSICQ